MPHYYWPPYNPPMPPFGPPYMPVYPMPVYDWYWMYRGPAQSPETPQQPPTTQPPATQPPAPPTSPTPPTPPTQPAPGVPPMPTPPVTAPLAGAGSPGWYPEVAVTARNTAAGLAAGRPLFGPAIANPVLGGLMGGRINNALMSLLNMLFPGYTQRVERAYLDAAQAAAQQAALQNLAERAGFGPALTADLMAGAGWGNLAGGVRELATIRADPAAYGMSLVGPIDWEKEIEKTAGGSGGSSGTSGSGGATTSGGAASPDKENDRENTGGDWSFW